MSGPGRDITSTSRASRPEVSGRDVEQRRIDVLAHVKDAVTVPVAVKLSRHCSSMGQIACKRDDAGADGLVFFNRFPVLDIDSDKLVVLPGVDLSQPAEGRVPRTWIALLRGRVRAGLAASTGVERRPRSPNTCSPTPTSP